MRDIRFYPSQSFFFSVLVLPLSDVSVRKEIEGKETSEFAVTFSSSSFSRVSIGYVVALYPEYAYLLMSVGFVFLFQWHFLAKACMGSPTPVSGVISR